MNKTISSRPLARMRWRVKRYFAAGVIAALSGAAIASPTAQMYTFAEGRVGEYNTNLSLDPIVTTVRGHVMSMKAAPNWDLARAYFDVSNDGVAVFSENNGDISAWSMKHNSLVNVSNYAFATTTKITANGDQIVMPTGRVFVREESPSGFAYKPWINTGLEHTYVSQDAQYYPGGYVAQSRRPGYGQFVFYPVVAEAFGRFYASSFNGDMRYPLHFYEEVFPAAVDANGSNFLMRRKNGYLLPNWTVGQNLYEHSENQDMIRMDRSGQYKVGITNVRASSTFTRNGEHLLAYGPLDECASFDEREARYCAYIWHFPTHSMTKIGGIQPFAMADDMSFVVGQVLNFEANLAEDRVAVFWDPVNGIRYFQDAMLDYGLDLDGWSEIFPLDVSPDSSKITGHALNPQGQRVGFVIDLPHKASEKWQKYDSHGSLVSYEGNWESDTEGSAYASEAKKSDQFGAKLYYKFDGTRVRVLGAKGLDRGYFSVYIDGVFWGRFSAFECAQPYVGVLFESDYLGEGEHEIVVEVEAAHDYASAGEAVGVDAFEVETYTPKAPSAYLTGLVPQPVSTTLDHQFITKKWVGVFEDNFNQTPPDASCNGCKTARSNWAYSRASLNQSFDDVVSSNGDFSIEAWIEYEPMTTSMYSDDYQVATLFEGASQGKRMRVALQNDRIWLNEQSSVASPVNILDKHMDHVVLSGNWNAEQADLYINNQWIGSAEFIDDPAAVQEEFSIARPLGLNGDHHMDVDFAKLSFYKEAFDTSEIQELFSWPSKYGLDFAPYMSPESSLWLPTCGLGGCEAGVELDYLPIDDGYGLPALGGVPVSGGVGGF